MNATAYMRDWFVMLLCTCILGWMYQLTHEGIKFTVDGTQHQIRANH